MRQKLRGSPGFKYAKTDLYDPVGRTFYIQYSSGFIIVLALAGVAAFAVTGFLGYTDVRKDPTIDPPFSQPWVLYLWLSALMVTLIASILRDVNLRSRLIAMLVVSFIAIVLIGILRLGDQLKNLLPGLQNLLNQHRLLNSLGRSPATYIVVNFGIIGIFWADTIRRWRRFRLGLPLDPRADIGLGEPGESKPAKPEDRPSFSELISGDLLASALLALLLSGIFRVETLGPILHPEGGLKTCYLSWFGTCGGGATVFDPPTLSFLDLIQSLLYLPLGLIVLALSATINGLGAVHGVSDLDVALASTSISSQSSAAPIAEDVAQTLLKTIQSALSRRLVLLGNNLLISLRILGWPALLFVATFFTVDVANGIQGYLHSDKDLKAAVQYVLPAAGWSLVAMLSVVGSVALMLLRFRVVDNTLRFLGLIGFVLLLTFWIFSLAMWGFNQLFYQLSVPHSRHPFDPPGYSTLLSLGALLVIGLVLVVRNLRSGRTAAGQPTSQPTVAVTAGDTASRTASLPPGPSSS